MINTASSRRGVALLITLAAVVVVVVACASLARVAVTTAVTRSIDERDERAADMLRAAEAPIQRWLRERSSQVVLSPDAVAPNTMVLDDLMGVVDGASGMDGDEPARLRIVAWDQRGMVPPSLLRRGVPMRSALPPEVVKQVDNARKAHSETIETSPGLDLFAGNASPYPQGTSGPITRYGNLSASILPTKERMALGGFVATHNPPVRETRSRRRSRSKPSPAINVNTAPIDVIESAMRMANLRGIEQVIEARERGELASVGSGSAMGKPLPNAPSLIAASDAWSIRIDASIGSLTRSWWAVYIRDQGAWRCVQRLEINQ